MAPPGSADLALATPRPGLVASAVLAGPMIRTDIAGRVVPHAAVAVVAIAAVAAAVAATKATKVKDTAAPDTALVAAVPANPDSSTDC